MITKYPVQIGRNVVSSQAVTFILFLISITFVISKRLCRFGQDYCHCIIVITNARRKGTTPIIEFLNSESCNMHIKLVSA